VLGFAIVIANLQLMFWERFSLDIVQLLLSRRDKIWLWWAMPTLQFSIVFRGLRNRVSFQNFNIHLQNHKRNPVSWLKYNPYF